MKPFVWQVINNKAFGWTERGKVFGGWLVRSCAIENITKADGLPNENLHPCMSICFVPDPEHKWEVLLDKDLQ